MLLYEILLIGSQNVLHLGQMTLSICLLLTQLLHRKLKMFKYTKEVSVSFPIVIFELHSFQAVYFFRFLAINQNMLMQEKQESTSNQGALVSAFLAKSIEKGSRVKFEDNQSFGKLNSRMAFLNSDLVREYVSVTNNPFLSCKLHVKENGESTITSKYMFWSAILVSISVSN